MPSPIDPDPEELDDGPEAEGEDDPGKAENRRIHAAVRTVVRNRYRDLGLTQRGWAGAARIPYRTIQRLDKGDGWSVGYLVRCAGALGVDPAVILTEAGVSTVTSDAVSAVALDPTMSVEHRQALALLIRSIRHSQLPGAEQ